MKNIFRIYKRDVKKICSNYTALVIAIGLAILPSLYAWVNIHASWDPYGNTRGIKVAVSSEDKGVLIEGQEVNLGDKVIKNLRANDSIGWQFVSTKEAIDGVYSGEYYASIIIPEDFSDKIGSILKGDIQRPKLQYYVNEKKNAIAPKITDKGVSTLQNTINKAFVKEISKVVLTALNVGEKVFKEKGIDPVADILSLLKSSKESLEDFSTGIKSFEATAEAIGDLVEATNLIMPDIKDINESSINQLDGLKSSVESGEAMAHQLGDSVSNIVDVIRDDNEQIQKDLESTFSNLSQLGESSYNQLMPIKARLQKVYDANNKLSIVLERIRSTAKIFGLKTKAIDNIIDKINRVNISITNTEKNIQQLADLMKTGSDYPKELLNVIVKDMNYVNSTMDDISDVYKDEVVPLIENQMTNGFSNIDNIQGILSKMNLTLPKMTAAMGKTQDAVNNSIEALKNTNILVGKSISKVDGIIKELESVESDERFSKLIEIISENPELAGDFISSPVLVDTNEIYPIENYGSAMASFYSILAIWVGSLILTAIIKFKVEEDENIRNIKPYEEYLGRYLIFMTIGILQGIIVCLGDLYLLRIQCLEPARFIFAGAFSSIVFTMITYTLAVSLGDVGKAIAVIFMIFQVAGAGGTFPIEITSTFFILINPFLPFTFGIDAMRECIAGMYENYYLINLIKLSLYIPISLVVGLALRKPIIDLKEFLEEKIEKTGLM
ncbi:MAG: YhgE/Pip family protein [Filifactoraceae bacterium]